ncbi:MAG: hypothetical protein HY074_02055 [Deltaproteobacteria bacterium]|nr:hypothetical protein [Deltaproteobacteria bacterium]
MRAKVKSKAVVQGHGLPQRGSTSSRTLRRLKKVLKRAPRVSLAIGFTLSMAALNSQATPTNRFNISINPSLTEAIQGQAVQIASTATLTQNQGKGTTFAADCLWNTKIVQSVAPRNLSAGQSLGCSTNTGRLTPASSSNTNTYTMNVYKTEPSGQRQLYNTQSTTISVHGDTVPPVYSCSTPGVPFSNPYMKILPAPQCAIFDPYGYLDSQNLTHVLLDSQDVTGRFQISPQGSGPWYSTYLIMGDLNPIAEGNHTLTIQGGQDLAGNQAAPFSFSFTIDRSPPTLAWSSSTHDNVLTNQKLFPLAASCLDNLSPTKTTFIANGQSIAVSNDSFPQATATLSEGLNTVTVQCVDRAGNQAPELTLNNIVLDTTAPVISVSPASGTTVSSLSVPFSVVCNKTLSTIEA